MWDLVSRNDCDTWTVSILLCEIMSCCGGNCGCGAACKCGNGCSGCKMFPDLAEGSITTETLIVGVAPKTAFLDGEMEVGAENGCKCGDNCSCNPCK